MNNSPTNTRFGKTCLALFGLGLPGKKPHPFVRGQSSCDRS